MNSNDERILAEREESLKERLSPECYSEGQVILGRVNMTYEMGEKARGIACGGIGAIHELVTRLKLPEAINGAVKLLKVHKPYYESDHVLNVAYNVIAGGRVLQDIECRRQDETFLDALKALRIPDPTTAGDFARRFESEGPIVQLQEAINDVREKVWNRQPKSFRKLGILDVDGTMGETDGECKRDIGLSYDKKWGYGVLLVSLANTGEPLYLANRSGNTPSHADAVRWMDLGIQRAKKTFRQVLLRGDTAFSSTEHLDRWDGEGVKFIFGYDACANLKAMAEALPEQAWRSLKRPARYTVKTSPRQKPEHLKEEIIRERGYKNIRLNSEQVAEFEYRPVACKKVYRMLVIRKNLSVEKGDVRLFDEIRYFFYITNVRESTTEELIFTINDRCNQENLIAQLGDGIGALRMPLGDLNSNWAYMVMVALAWTLKAWYALLMVDRKKKRQALKMEFKGFEQRYLQIPCQILRTGRRVVYRILTYTSYLETFLRTFERIKTLKFA